MPRAWRPGLRASGKTEKEYLKHHYGVCPSVPWILQFPRQWQDRIDFVSLYSDPLRGFADNLSSKSRSVVRLPAHILHMSPRAYNNFNSICDIQDKFRPAIFEYGKV